MSGNHDGDKFASSVYGSSLPHGRCHASAISTNLAATPSGAGLRLVGRIGGPAAKTVAGLIREIGEIVRTHAVLLGNSTALLVSTGATAAIGFVFWWIAARHFSAEAVGIASAAVALMNFLALIGECGLGTLLIGETLRKPSESAGLIAAALVTSVASSSLFCLGYLAMAETRPLRSLGVIESDLNGVVLLSGCAIIGAAMVLDSAFVGLLRSFLQTWRTLLASALKMGLLLTAAYAGFAGSALTIVLALLGGQVLSILVLAGFLVHRGYRIWYAPDFRSLRRLAPDVLGHHLLNLAAQSANLVMPLLVTSMLSAAINAAFYASWMIFNVILLGPASLTTLLFTVGVAEPARVQQRLRFSLWICALGSPIASLVLAFGASHILSIFGSLYAAEGGPVLRILAAAVFAVTIKYHYIAVQRLRNSMASASLLLGGAAIVELAFAAAGAHLGGLVGLAEGWVIAAYLEALVMTPALVKFAFAETQAIGPARTANSPHGSERTTAGLPRNIRGFLAKARLTAVAAAAISIPVAPLLAPMAAPIVSHETAAPPTQIADQAAYQTFSPAERGGVIKNPGIGYQTFYHSAAVDRQLPSSTMYLRFNWSTIEPAPGIFDFGRIDAALSLARAAGQRLAFRIMGYDNGNTGPVALKKAGYPGFAFRFEGTDVWVPDLDDDGVQRDLQKLIATLGRRYGDNGAIDSVDLGLIGDWGEQHFWNTYPTPPYPSLRTLRWLSDVFREHFEVPVLVNDGVWENNPDAFQYAIQRGLGWRADCWGGQREMSWKYPQILADVPDAWRIAPVIMEPCGVMSLWPSFGYPWQKTFQWAIDNHISQFSNKSAPIPHDMIADASAMLGRLGYRLVLRHARFPRVVKIGSDFRLQLEWENKGNAPMYFGRNVLLKLGSRNTDTGISMQGFAPGTRTDLVSLQTVGLRAGTYPVEIAVGLPAAKDPDITLAIEGDGPWYSLGDVILIN